MAAELVLVRHGATDASAELLSGQTDPPLSEEGRAQAERLAARLGHDEIDALYGTPLMRTTQTAAPLAKEIGIEIIAVPELREIHLGELEATLSSIDGHRSLLGAVLAAGRWDLAPGAEPMADFADRVALGVQRIGEGVPGRGRTVAVTHGGVIAEACRQATGSRPLAFLPALRHCSITRFQVTGDHLTLTAFNDVAHLEKRLP